MLPPSGERMKALKVHFDKARDEIIPVDPDKEENWIDICQRFDDDVHRVRDVRAHEPYTALYACYDDNNQPTHFLVEEDRQLDRIRHKVFLNKLGRN